MFPIEATVEAEKSEELSQLKAWQEAGKESLVVLMSLEKKPNLSEGINFFLCLTRKHEKTQREIGQSLSQPVSQEAEKNRFEVTSCSKDENQVNGGSKHSVLPSGSAPSQTQGFLQDKLYSTLAY